MGHHSPTQCFHQTDLLKIESSLAFTFLSKELENRPCEGRQTQARRNQIRQKLIQTVNKSSELLELFFTKLSGWKRIKLSLERGLTSMSWGSVPLCSCKQQPRCSDRPTYHCGGKTKYMGRQKYILSVFCMKWNKVFHMRMK